VTHHQKLIIAGLAGVAIVIFVFLGCLAFFLIQTPTESQPALAAAAQPGTPIPTGIASPIATPLPPAAIPPTETPPPTPTSTRVVTQTVLPTPEPTRPNCINDISNFEASGVLTNQQVQTYLRGTIPLSHLDNCLGIRYIDQFVAVHATPAAGKFIPLFRQISVYRIGQQSQTAAALLETLTHEVGHNVHFNMRIDNWDLAVRWRELYVASEGTFAERGLGFVSDYARADYFEDFAETYRAYILEPETLKAANPEKYEFMRQEVFAGREY
jgi:hypothetical protein